MRHNLNNILNTLKDILNSEGLRYTTQRQEVWNELRSSEKHRDAEEILITLKARGLNVSRATLYRTIEVLVKHNMIEKLDIGDGKARFEYNNKFDHHDHLVCTNCGKIIEFHSDEIEKLQKQISSKYNFKLVDHNHQLFGLCKDCK